MRPPPDRIPVPKLPSHFLFGRATLNRAYGEIFAIHCGYMGKAHVEALIEVVGRDRLCSIIEVSGKVKEMNTSQKLNSDKENLELVLILLLEIVAGVCDGLHQGPYSPQVVPVCHCPS